jgi:hypothetical protein
MNTGAPWNGAINIYYHSTANASAIYKGSLVFSNTGLGDGVGASPDGKYQEVIIAPDGRAGLIGVAWTFGNTPQLAADVTNLNNKNFCPASTAMYIGVIDDPTVIYQIQDSSVLTAADVGLNFDTTSGADGSTVTGRSSAELRSTGSTGTAQLHLLRMVAREDNSLLVNADWEVMINERRITGDGSVATT